MREQRWLTRKQRVEKSESRNRQEIGMTKVTESMEMSGIKYHKHQNGNVNELNVYE